MSGRNGGGVNGRNGRHGPKPSKGLSVARLMIEAVDHAGVPVLAVTGDADMGTSWALEDALPHARKAARAAGVPLTVDLRGVTFLDSTGATVLLRAHRQEREETGGGLVLLLGSNTQPLRVIRLLRFHDLFRVLLLEPTAGSEAVAQAIRAKRLPSPEERGQQEETGDQDVR